MRLLTTLEYDGTEFQGFQIQKRGRTVQEELERAIARVTGAKVRVVGGGRTDAGVHAAGQTAHFDTDWQRSLEELHRALNAVLPKDVAIQTCTRVPDQFSARYSATSRSYRYTILNQPIRSPLAGRFALIVPEPLDAAAMAAAATVLVGQKDFGAFGTPPRGDNCVRVVYRAEVGREGARVWVELEANAFLYRMVRRIVGTLLWVGKGRMRAEEFRAVLEKRRRAEQSAPPQGLCLIAVSYPP
jgi:tRNA pseudouridine38-40 synthase